MIPPLYLLIDYTILDLLVDAEVEIEQGGDGEDARHDQLGPEHVVPIDRYKIYKDINI